jgi:putative transposase
MIQASVQRQGHVGIERMCALAGISRAGYYRHWRTSAPCQEETALRDEVQRLSLANRHYGVRRITVLLHRSGWAVNHKRVVRLRREDNLLCVAKRSFVPPTTDSRHRFRLYPNLARRVEPLALNQLWVADITYLRLAEEFVYLAVVLDAFSRRVPAGRNRPAPRRRRTPAPRPPRAGSPHNPRAFRRRSSADWEAAARSWR